MSDDKGRLLQIFRDGRRHTAKQLLQLPPNAQGNLKTLSIMAQIVREDAREKDLKNLFLRQYIGFDKSISEQIETAFELCRDGIIYEPEKAGLETVADIWSCFFAFNPRFAVGDCVLKSVALATLFSWLNLKPAFVAIKQIPNADFFNHVYVQLDGKPYDATPKDFRPGDELTNRAKLIYKIF